MPFFNDLTLRPTYLDKNLSDSFLSITQSPATLIKRMHGHYYDADNQPLTSSAAHQRLIDASQPQIIKGSRTDNGDNIHLLESHNGCLEIDGETTPFTDLENHFGNNYIVQEKITQHPLIAKPHPSSVNTIRIVSFRWQDEIHILLSILRFGIDGNIFDNASNGGIFCGIDRNGETHKTAFDKKGTAYCVHPTSGYEFSNQITIPNYPQLCELAVELHSQIFHFDIVSWDFSISPQSEPIFLEVNFRGSADTYQLASGKPLFGNLTDEVLKTVRESRK
ncbi:sugar-transfer associated ATP-grasp domain-containing protein [Candidatus Reidiella endopervernicosa]|nr:sugar-transfer associated ATP-grasp domain-containing protein [Candidatus Reidiella endopervernicosa]QKQ24981.1 hypothetical protein HUE57_00780 [Candidatus Reidiella endopervernicosa]